MLLAWGERGVYWRERRERNTPYQSKPGRKNDEGRRRDYSFGTWELSLVYLRGGEVELRIKREWRDLSTRKEQGELGDGSSDRGSWRKEVRFRWGSYLYIKEERIKGKEGGILAEKKKKSSLKKKKISSFACREGGESVHAVDSFESEVEEGRGKGGSQNITSSWLPGVAQRGLYGVREDRKDSSGKMARRSA